MAFLRRKTGDGHVVGEVYSGLQKSIRRGLEDKALYFAEQIASVSENALKKRICLIVLEDVCNIELAFKCFECPLDMDKLRDLTIAAARAPKTHMSAWLNRYSIECLLQSHEVSYGAVGALAAGGRELEAAVRGQWLRRRGDGAAVLSELAAEWAELGLGDMDKLMKLYKYANESPLVWLGIVAWCCRPELRAVNASSLIGGAAGAGCSRVVPTLSQLPDWVFDKHTALGKRLKLGYQHFFDVSLLMVNRVYAEGCEPYEVDTKALYLSNELKSHRVLSGVKPGSIKLRPFDSRIQYVIDIPATSNGSTAALRAVGDTTVESDPRPAKRARLAHTSNAAVYSGSTDLHSADEIFDRVLQAQCVTSRSKPRVFFCRRRESGVIQVLKGPDTVQHITQYLTAQHFKEVLGLPSASVVGVSFAALPAKSACNIPMGEYLLSRYVGDSVGFSFDSCTRRTTKLETDVDVSANVIVHWSHDLMCTTADKDIQLQLLLCLAFRKCIGTNDTCSRNLICEGGVVVSIDDPALFRPTPYMWKTPLSGSTLTAYKNALQFHWDHVCTKLLEWKSVIDGLLCEVSAFSTESLTFFSSTLQELLNGTGNWKF